MDKGKTNGTGQECVDIKCSWTCGEDEIALKDSDMTTRLGYDR